MCGGCCHHRCRCWCNHWYWHRPAYPYVHPYYVPVVPVAVQPVPLRPFVDVRKGVQQATSALRMK